MPTMASRAAAFWTAIDNISKRSYCCAIAVWCVCKNTRIIWEIPEFMILTNDIGQSHIMDSVFRLRKNMKGGGTWPSFCT